MAYSFTEEDRRRAHLQSQSEEARGRREETRELNRRLLEQDIRLLRDRGLVPIAIAGKLQVPVDRVSEVLRRYRYEIPGYLTTSGPTPEPDVCPHCLKVIS